MKEEIEELWKKYNDYKEIGGQHENALDISRRFVLLLRFDSLLMPAYEDLQENYTSEHAKRFINGMKNIVFKQLGIE